MKKFPLFLLLISTMLFASCIQDEALNVEAAIDDCSGSGLYSVTKDDLAKTIELYVLKEDSIQELIFTLPQGATIRPETEVKSDTISKSRYDFREHAIRRFIVTAEDGITTATYRIRYNKIMLPVSYSFENLKQSSPYNIIYLTNSEDVMEWASGNQGFNLASSESTPDEYPTAQIMEGYRGRGVRLQTRSTGEFGDMVDMRIAAGNLFIGSFNMASALTAPLEATHFGFPFTRMPVRMTGWYKYQSGGEMQDADGNPLGTNDTGDFYAVLYEAPTIDYSLDGDLFPIDGRPQNEHIVLVARIPKTKETGDTWTYFDLPFEPVEGKTVDREGLANGEYKLAIVFSSSKEGAYFRGAVGSTLWIDEVNIECEESTNEEQQ